MAAAAVEFGYEVGLCHDLIEKTKTTADEFYEGLTIFGYNPGEALQIQSEVIALTNVFTKATFPLLAKKQRKQKEAARLATISPAAQTVKYCDLIYNTEWMLKYKPGSATKYLDEKLLLLKKMNKGDTLLYNRVVELMNTSRPGV